MSPATELLRLSTAGSVDDGKSTLIGRLLHDAKTVFVDQLAEAETASESRGDERTNLALLTDGLRAEREQGITIDVAYRYFATPKRSFIIADTPGHVQYTRNMVTGASTAQVALILVDARNGLTEQSRRHAHIAALLGITDVVVVVNKMDLVDWSQDRFAEIRQEFAGLDLPPRISFLPISALHGDNVVERSDRMPWYEGPPLLEVLETMPIVDDPGSTSGRLPVQWVIEPREASEAAQRGYAGRVAGGTLRPGQPVVVLPSGQRTTVRAIETLEGPLESAAPPASVTVLLADEVACERGDVIADAEDPPVTSEDAEAMLCWMGDEPLRADGRYVIKQSTRAAQAVVTELVDRLDVTTGDRQQAPAELAANDMGRVRLRADSPLVYDPYVRNRRTGSLILIDPSTNVTVAAGMLR